MYVVGVWRGTVADLDALFLLIYGCDISKHNRLGVGNIAQSRQVGKKDSSLYRREREAPVIALPHFATRGGSRFDPPLFV